MKMLSKQAEQFIVELRMYLMSRGKKEQEINEVIDELTDHMIQAESQGKNIKDITGASPREYMKSIWQEMKFDLKEILILAPMTSLLIVAFFCLPSSIQGDFSLSKIGVWGGIIGVVLSIMLIGFLLVRVLPKTIHSKWFYIIVGLMHIVLTGFFVLVFIFDKEPFFVATPLQNNLILIGCILIFIIWSLYAKTWITIIIPLLMSLGPITQRFVPAEINENPHYVTLTLIIGIPVLIIGFYFMFRKRKTTI